MEVDLAKKKLTLKTFLSKEIRQNEHCGFVQKEYLVLPEYGKGTITEYCFDGVTISINNFSFRHNFIFYNELDINALYLSFLIKGDMLLKVNNINDEIPYGENESFMAYIERFSGTFKIYDKRPFKEIKVTVTNSFLKKHGLNDMSSFKKISDQNLTLPIANNVFSIIEALEIKRGEGLVQRLYLGAKVIEIIALQMGNYKAINPKQIGVSGQRPMKKLFVLKQFLNDNLNKNFALNELAEEIGLSENVLKSEFKRVFNCTVNQYFLEQKMKKAKRLLQNTDCPIYEVAEHVGYKNATHFSAAFKRFYKETPKLFRSKI